MKKETRMKLEKVFDTLGEIIAFVAVVLLVLYYFDINYKFLPETVENVLTFCKEWLGLILIAVTGFECTIKRNIVIRIIFYILIAALVIMMFMPGTTSWLISLIPSK